MQTTGYEGRVESLHLHPLESGQPMISVDHMILIANKGIMGNVRYYDTLNKISGKPNMNHLSLLEREQISDYLRYIDLNEILPGWLRSNIETSGVDLMNLVGFNVKIGNTAIVNFYKSRVPCKQMDLIHPHLQKLMKKDKQGVIAKIIISGEITVGDIIQIVE